MKKFKKIMSLALCLVILSESSMVFAQNEAISQNGVNGTPGGLTYRTHVQDIGWQDWKTDGVLGGTTGQSLRLEGIELNLNKNDSYVRLRYETHIQNIGWQGYVNEGKLSGTTGQCLRLEAIRIFLYGPDSDLYDIYYRVHAQNFGWLGWAKNGEKSGTAGYSDRLEGINVILVLKGEAPPATDATFAFIEPARPVSGTNADGFWNGVFTGIEYDATGSPGGEVGFSGN